MKPKPDEKKKMATRLQRVGARLDQFAASDAAHRARIEEAKAKHRSVQSQFDAVNAAGGEGWETGKAGLDRAWKELVLVYREVRS
jgi:hypothetical protein